MRRIYKGSLLGVVVARIIVIVFVLCLNVIGIALTVVAVRWLLTLGC